MPDGSLAKGNWEQVEIAVKIANCLGRDIATPDEAREIMGIGQYRIFDDLLQEQVLNQSFCP
jgi:hypothetical protein